MPILSRVGRRHPRMRLLVFFIYVALIIGAVSMVYPFLVMLSGSTKSDLDAYSFDIIPTFLRDDELLYKKHIEGLFNESLSSLNMTYGSLSNGAERLSFADVVPPETNQFTRAWSDFIASTNLPSSAWTLGYVSTPNSKTFAKHLRGFKTELGEETDGSISRLNLNYETEFVSWNAFNVIPEQYLPRLYKVLKTPMAKRWVRYREQQALHERLWFLVEPFYVSRFLRSQYGSIENYNEAHQTSVESYADIRLAETFPVNEPAAVQKDWEDFVRRSLNLLWIRVSQSAATDYQAMLKAKYQGIDTLNFRYESSYASFDEIPIPRYVEIQGPVLTDYESFISGWRDAETEVIYQAPVEALRIESTELAFRRYLIDRYESNAKINQAFGTDFASLNDISPPLEAFHYQGFLTHRSEIKREFLFRNYITVFDYLLRHGRGMLNTIIYCGLAVLIALIVNPMAAYALSRYQMPGTYKWLLFMLLTMAFPPMVTQIPVFLMLRDFNMLNTFAALLLPGLAHGYSIFLLKGFFDSLPQELFESAEMDGAGQWTMFWQITMSLSKPVLAVIALSAFTAAYSDFMFALLRCQDESMWTLMVWLYQLHEQTGQPVRYAALIMAAIPTFLIFVFCQNIIMRGIVIPVEK